MPNKCRNSQMKQIIRMAYMLFYHINQNILRHSCDGSVIVFNPKASSDSS